MDVHVPYAVTLQLRRLGIDVVTAQEDGTKKLDDPKLLDRASGLERVLVTQDYDLLREAALRQNQMRPFVGVIFAHPKRITIGGFIADLEFLSASSNREDWTSRVEYLPLK